VRMSSRKKKKAQICSCLGEKVFFLVCHRSPACFDMLRYVVFWTSLYGGLDSLCGALDTNFVLTLVAVAKLDYIRTLFLLFLAKSSLRYDSLKVKQLVHRSVSSAMRWQSPAHGLDFPLLPR